MIPILLCSVIAAAISVERFWTLRADQVAPKNLLAQVWTWIKNNEMDNKRLRELKNGSPLGQILAAGISSHRKGRDAMKESIEEVANHVVHEMERYLNTLGTVAAITPLLGLLGTVIGMIATFQAITLFGTGDPKTMAGGISQALVTTVLGLTVAIPTVLLHAIVSARATAVINTLKHQTAGLIAERMESRAA